MDKRSSHINAVDKEQEQPEQPQQHKQPRIWAQAEQLPQQLTQWQIPAIWFQLFKKWQQIIMYLLQDNEPQPKRMPQKYQGQQSMCG